MTRLIDADALKEYIDCGHLRNPCEVCFSELDVVDLIDAQPTIDAEPVIRCKDCRWWWEGMRVCALKEHLVDGVCAVLCMEDDFCSRAEPKDTTEEVRKQLKDMEQRREMDRKK